MGWYLFSPVCGRMQDARFDGAKRDNQLVQHLFAIRGDWPQSCLVSRDALAAGCDSASQRDFYMSRCCRQSCFLNHEIHETHETTGLIFVVQLQDVVLNHGWQTETTEDFRSRIVRGGEVPF